MKEPGATLAFLAQRMRKQTLTLTQTADSLRKLLLLSLVDFSALVVH